VDRRTGLDAVPQPIMEYRSPARSPVCDIITLSLSLALSLNRILCQNMRLSLLEQFSCRLLEIVSASVHKKVEYELMESEGHNVL
jgi:hypothetical protein